jgi:hypothetical protein
MIRVHLAIAAVKQPFAILTEMIAEHHPSELEIAV